jgi:hypothetical protein
MLEGTNEDKIFEKVNPIVESVAQLDRAELATFFEILSARFSQGCMDVSESTGDSIAFSLDKIVGLACDVPAINNIYR